MPRANEFLIVSAQAVAFTPEAEFATGRFSSRVLPNWLARFDGDPISLPLPEGVPREFPKLILQSRSSEWRCEISSARISIFWRRSSIEGGAIDLADFYGAIVPMLSDYREFIDSPIRRLAAVITRSALQQAPGLYLARHFCQERWLVAPFNRPESFELHAHKTYQMNADFTVNSWVRNKTGQVAGDERPVVLVEQDLNTVLDNTKEFSSLQVAQFFGSAPSEMNEIIKLYYPENAADGE